MWVWDSVQNSPSKKLVGQKEVMTWMQLWGLGGKLLVIQVALKELWVKRN